MLRRCWRSGRSGGRRRRTLAASRSRLTKGRGASHGRMGLAANRIRMIRIIGIVTLTFFVIIRVADISFSRVRYEHHRRHLLHKQRQRDTCCLWPGCHK